MASRFWVGGTGTWDASDTTHWSGTSGGGGGSSVPGSADTATFDGASGGGTVTVNTNPNIDTMTMGAFTGTIDFSANNNNIQLKNFSGTGTGTRTLNMGNGTWTMTGGFSSTTWDMTTVTGFTFNCNSSTLAFSATGANSPRTWLTGGKTYSTVTIAEATAGFNFLLLSSPTIANLTLTAPLMVGMSAGGTVTITNSITAAGTAFNSAIMLTPQNQSSTGCTISKTSGSITFDWLVLQKMFFSGGATFAATNSFNLGGNTGITITGPTGSTVGVFGASWSMVSRPGVVGY